MCYQVTMTHYNGLTDIRIIILFIATYVKYAMYPLLLYSPIIA